MDEMKDSTKLIIVVGLIASFVGAIVWVFYLGPLRKIAQEKEDKKRPVG